MTKTQLDKARELTKEILDYEYDIHAIRGAEAALHFIMESQDEYTYNALYLVLQRLRDIADKMERMHRQAIELGKIATGEER
ncbi:MAG: hypothetical protein GXO16_05880 [Epsilonproteobacteria bacterium]|nr:hypothetical protein [Campylobacterota bacterium]